MINYAIIIILMRLNFPTVTSGLPLAEYSTKVVDNTILINRKDSHNIVILFSYDHTIPS